MRRVCITANLPRVSRFPGDAPQITSMPGKHKEGWHDHWVMLGRVDCIGIQLLPRRLNQTLDRDRC